MVQLTTTHTTTQTKMFVSSRVLYFVRAAGNLSLFLCVSFFFLHIFFTIKNPSSLCVLRIAFPEPFRFDPGDARRSATTTTTDDEYNYVLFRHRSVEASLGRRHVRDADADVRREILVYGCESRRARNAAADHVWYAKRDVCEEEDERLEGKRRDDDYSLAVLFFVFLLVSTTTLMTLSLLTKLLCALKGDSIEGVLHVSPGTPKTRRSKAIYLCRRLGVPLLWSL